MLKFGLATKDYNRSMKIAIRVKKQAVGVKI